MRRLLLAAAIVAVSASPARAYLRENWTPTGGGGLSWNLAGRTPSSSFDSSGRVMYRVVTSGVYAFPDANYIASLQNAFQTWEDVPNAAIRLARGPDITAASFSQGFSMGFTNGSTCQWGSSIGGAAGLTIYSYDGSNHFSDVDICFARSVGFNLDGTASNHFESTALHEAGHAIGLEHDPYVMSTMSYVGQRDMHTPETTPYLGGRRATFNDSLAIALAYPEAGWLAAQGAVAGTLLAGTTNVHQGAVGAYDSQSGLLVAATLSRLGRYRFDALPPGTYILRAFPSLNAPYYYLNQHPSTLAWTSDGAPTNFLATSANDATGVSVTAGATTTRNVGVLTGTSRQVYTDSIWRTAGGSWGTGTMTIRAPRGASIRVGVSGIENATYDFPQSASQVGALELWGTGVTITGGPYFSGDSRAPSWPNTFTFDVSIAANATPGIRALSVTNSAIGQRFVVMGYLEVVDPGALAVAAGAANPPSKNPSAGAANVSVVQVALTPAGEPARIRSVTVKASGTGNDTTGILRAKLYRDVNNNGVVDVGTDVQLGGALTFAANDGTVVFSGLYETAPVGVVTNYVVGYDFATGAPAGTTYRAEVTAMTVNGVDSGRGISATGMPVGGGWVTLGTAPSPTMTVAPATLSFAAGVGSANPATQSFTVTNSGLANSTLSFTLADNATWLSATPTSGSLATGAAATIDVTAATSGLAAGTYTGTITITDPLATNNPRTVGVTFVISPAPTIAVNPATLSFAGTAGGPSPAAQTFTVANSGAATSTLGYAVSDNAAWLAVSPASGSIAGNGSDTITVTPAIAGLAAGTHTATITVTDPAASNNPRTVAVTLTLAAAPVITLSPTTLSYVAVAGGGDPAGQSFTVTNSGPAGSTLAFAAADNASWLSVSPASGSLASGAAATIAVSVSALGLTAGTYNGTITVSDPLASNNPRTVAVTLSVSPAPAITLSPTSLAFSAVAGGSDPLAQTFTVTNSGPAGSSLSFAVSESATWLTLTPASGTLAPGVSRTITVSVATAGLTAGTYTATIAVSDPLATNSPRNVSVTFQVAPAPALSLSPSSLSFTCVAGGPAPAMQTFTVANSGPTGSTLSYTVADNASWLGAAPTGGTIAGTAADTISVTVNNAGLAAGSYAATITVSDPLATNNPRTVSIALTVDAAPTIGLSATSLGFSAVAGSADPAGQSFTVSNTGGAGSSLSFAISDNAAWLGATPVTGTLASGGSQTIAVSASIAGLAAGTYSATLTVADPLASNNPRTVSVTLTVAAAPVISLGATSLSFAATVSGPDPGEQTVTLTNSGPETSTLSFTVSDDAAWLTVTPDTGLAGSLTSRTLTVAASNAGLAAGTYTATITVSDPLATNNPRTVAVTFVVSPRATIALGASALAFSATAGGASPAAKTFTVTNSGPTGSTLRFLVDDDAGWLSVSPASGTLGPGASATITATPDTTAIQAGSYSATINVTDPLATNTPRSVAVSLTLGAAPAIGLTPAGLVFSATAGGPEPLAQDFTVANSGSGGSTLDFTVADDAAWLTLSSASGSVGAGASKTISAAASIAGLAAGSYFATITVSDPLAANNPRTLGVTLTVKPAPAIALAPATMVFTSTAGGPDPAGQSFTVTNSGPAGSTLAYAVSDDAAWLTPTPASGTLLSGAAKGVDVAASASGLAAGTYSGTITVSDPLASNNPRTVAVTLTVLPAPAIALSPTTLSFAGVAAGADPAAQTFTVTNSGPAGSTLRFAVADDAAWLGASPQSGTLASGASATITVAPATAGLTAGAHPATITVSDSLASNGPRTVGVTLSLAAAPAIALGPGPLSFSAVAGGPAPAAQSFTVTNSGSAGSTLRYTISEDAAWLTLGLASGNLAAGAVQTIDATVTNAGLAAGAYNATITVTDPAAANSPRTLAVAYTVAPAAAITVAPATLTFTATAGGANPAGASFSVTNSGPAGSSLSFAVSDDASWLTATPATGVLAPGLSSSIAVAASIGGLGAGTYTATMTVYDRVVAQSFRTVAVTLNVLAPPEINVTPAALTFTASVGAADPAPQSFTLTNSRVGGGPLQYEITASASWLGATPASGTLAAGSALAISVAPRTAGLAVGTHTGSVIVTDPLASNSPRSVAVTLRVLQRPTSVVLTSGQYGSATWPGEIQGTAADAAGGTGVAAVEVRIRRGSDGLYWNGSAWTSDPAWIAAEDTVAWNVPFAPEDGVSYTVESRATDTLSGVQDPPAQSAFSADLTAPTTVITTRGHQSSVTWTGAIRGTAVDAVSGVSRVEVAIQRTSDNLFWDGSGWDTVRSALIATGTTEWSLPFSPQNGSYLLLARGQDGVNNREDPWVTGAFVYDAEGPDSSVATSGVFGPSTWPGAITGSAVTASGAQVSRVVVQIERVGDGKLWQGFDWGAGNGWLIASGGAAWSYTFGALDDTMTYEVRSSATDSEGGVEATPGVSRFTYDATAPASVVETAGDIPSGAWTGAIRGTATDALSGVKEVRASVKRLSDGSFWDGGEWQAIGRGILAEGAATWSLAFVADVGTTYEVRSLAEDQVQNVQERAVAVTFRVVAPPVGNGPPPVVVAPEGCGCGASAPIEPWSALVLLALLARPRRRRR